MSGATAHVPARAPRRPWPPASTWVAALAAVVVVAALTAAGRFVGGSLVAGCASQPAGCEQAGVWLERASTVQVGLGVIAVALVVATAARRARGARRVAVLVILCSVVTFFGSVLLAARSL